MGEAKRRGNFEQRKQEAIAAGCVKKPLRIYKRQTNGEDAFLVALLAARAAAARAKSSIESTQKRMA